MKGKSGRTPFDRGNDPGSRRVEPTAAFRKGLCTLAVEDVPIDSIDQGDQTFQSRLEVSLDDIKQSIAEEGQLQPVDLFAGQPHRIIDGFRRIRAIHELGRATAQAFIHSTLSEEDAHGLAYLKNVVRRNLTPADKAHAIYKARRRGRTTAQIAESFHVSNRQVQRYEALLSLPPDLMQLVSDNSLSMAHALILAHLGPAEIQVWARRCREHMWSASTLKHELRVAAGGGHHSRGRTYMHIEGDNLRFYGFELSLHAPPEHLDRVLASLDLATGLVREARGKWPRRDSDAGA